MRIPRLNVRTRHRLLSSGLFLIALSAALGQFAPTPTADERPSLHSVQASAHGEHADDPHCDQGKASA